LTFYTVERGYNPYANHPAIPEALFIARQIDTWIKSGEGTVEDNLGKHRGPSEFKEMWESNPLYLVIQKSRQYKDLAMKGVAGAVGVLSRIALEAAFPAANFLEYANVMQTDEVPVKFTVRSRPRAFEVVSSSSSVLVTGPQNVQTSVDAKSWKAHAEWDQEYVEDMAFPELQVSTSEIGESIAVQEAQNGIDQLHNIADADLAGANDLPAGETFAVVEDLITRIRKNQRRPSFLEMDEDSRGVYRKNTNMKDRTIFGEFNDYQRGVIGGFEGLNIFSSTLNETASANADQPMIGDGRFVAHVIRRETTLVPYAEKGVVGIWGSKRSGTGILEKGAFARTAAVFSS